MIRTGLDTLLEEVGSLAGRRYGLLAHAAAVSADGTPVHLALARAGAQPATLLFGPEHGFHGVEQDMVASADEVDPWTGWPVRSLYGDSEASLRPAADAFAELDLLLIDLQDVGSRYYTYAATAVWAAEAALAAGCETIVLDRPNPLGGTAIEGNLRRPGFESFVGAFEMPVRHGLTLAEIVRLEGRRRGWTAEVGVRLLTGWRRSMTWAELGRPWVAPSPNLPTPESAEVYPGACLIEATEISEGRGTTRPFQLIGAPGVDGPRLAERLEAAGLEGMRFSPVRFKPQYQKHAGRVCEGVSWRITDPALSRPLAAGVELLRSLLEVAPAAFAWREAPYEFVADRPAIDLLTGDAALRRALERGADPREWIDSWGDDEAVFRAERAEILLYPEETGE